MNLGRKMPADLTESDLRNLKFMSDFYNTLVFNGNFAKVLSTPTLRLLRSRMDSAVRNVTKWKMSFMFGHMSNIHPLLTIFNLTNTECLTEKWEDRPITSLNCVEAPQFAANMVIELHESDDKSSHFVKLRYNGYYVNLCQRKDT